MAGLNVIIWRLLELLYQEKDLETTSLYPGLNTHQRAIDAGDENAGATVHFVTEELDGGPPILQASVPIISGDDATTLAARVLEQEHRIYPAAAQWFAKGRLQLNGETALLDGASIPAGGRAGFCAGSV